jgi:hypothetical protein
MYAIGVLVLAAVASMDHRLRRHDLLLRHVGTRFAGVVLGRRGRNACSLQQRRIRRRSGDDLRGRTTGGVAGFVVSGGTVGNVVTNNAGCP